MHYHDKAFYEYNLTIKLLVYCWGFFIKSGPNTLTNKKWDFYCLSLTNILDVFIDNNWPKFVPYSRRTFQKYGYLRTNLAVRIVGDCAVLMPQLSCEDDSIAVFIDCDSRESLIPINYDWLIQKLNIH